MAITSNLKWNKEKDIWQLYNGEESLLSLGKKVKGQRPLFLENRSFKISEKGSWNPTWYIETERNEKILEMKFGFWSSKGKIRFQDGARYECHFRNMSNLQIIIYDLRYHEDLVSFQLETYEKGKARPKMVLHQKEVFTDKLLFLLGLGMSLFLQHYQEDADFTTTFLLLTS
ncbi:hypothetical protein [Arthrospiribacter ruber]|uniref:Uncharacterized protein n=1 Tax=Arthrospiribacter ruber TaxID=2487934 RepID=A0A951MAF7_9BACT|nr:hypothetical protein [Arthrospiribacter ruber]MBW3467921.1 hypothetical protein [Arthrospiribacter ruber]